MHMSAPNIALHWLFNHMLMLQWEGTGYQLKVWDAGTATWITLCGTGSGGGGGTPVIAPGGAPLAAEIVVLAGDPPDPVSFKGDYVWLRSYQPNFTLSSSGDVTVVEGM
jgi:hypothetical protein